MRIRSWILKGIMVALYALIFAIVFLGQDSMQPLADDGVIVIGSGVPPLSISQIGDDDDLSDGALAPIDKDVILKAVSDEAGSIHSAVFQSAKLSPDGSPAQWQNIPETVDLTILPDGSVIAVSKWDTTVIEPGRYDLRCISMDSHGNSNPEMAPIVHVVVGAGKYSAFITEPAGNGSVSGASTIVKAWVYNPSADLAGIKSVTFQYQGANGVWVTFDSITNSPANNLAGDPNAGIKRGYLQFPNYSEWHGRWNLTGLMAGEYRLRALVEDDKGYVNDGIAVSATFTGAAGVRTRIVNFSSDSGQNPRVSMNIARNSSVGDITVRDFKNLPVESIRVTFKAEKVGGVTPDRVRFEYLKNPMNNPANPKTAPASAWTLIDEDQYAEYGLWVADLDIDPSHELHNLAVATLIYVRAVAIKNNVDDSYVDEDDFVPYVGIIFEETTEPGCNIAMISRDGVSLGPAPSLEERVTGGELTVVPSAQSSDIAQVELYYKLFSELGFSDTQLKWIFADRDTSLPFTLLWDASDPIQIPSGRYELLVVASDQAGNRSANVWNSLDALRGQPNLIANLQIDHSEPTAYLEEPDPGGRLTPDTEIWVSASSYQGEIDEIILWFNLPGGWVEAGRASNFPAFGFRSVKTQFADFSNSLGGGYYYYDRNGNSIYDAGEPIWQDLPGGNTGWYNYSKRTAEESVLMGGPRPADETKGVRFEDIPGAVTGITCVEGVVKWGDSIASGGVVGGLDKTDFIWIDLPEPGYPNGDGIYDSSNDGTGEPIVYASGMIDWDGIMDLPPSNNMTLEFRVQACDKQDSSGSSGNCGPAFPSETMVGGATVAVQSVNNVAMWDFADEHLRVTGDTVRVVVRVWPEPMSGAEVQLWFRYDDGLNPGALDEDYDGYPDNGDVANSRWDGIDNDWDGVIDEEQTDRYGNDVKWGEVNVWRLASTTGGRTVTDREPGSAAEFPAKNWFEVTLTWNVSMLDDEHQYEFMPIVVDGSGYGVNFNYQSLPWKRSDAQFPQGPIISEYRIIIDHQAPYTYTQVVKNTDDYGPIDQGLDSWMPLIYPESQFAGPDSIIIRTNDGVNNNADAGGCYDEAGEDNYRLYDLQAKVVSIYGGLDYTNGFDEGLGGVGKFFNPNAGGVVFQYSTDGVTWQNLGYDPDPDYLSTFVATNAFNPVAMMSLPLQRYQGSEMSYVGEMIPYSGRIINSDGMLTGQAVAYTQRIVVTTWSLDNFDISTLPATNGAEYYFRAIAADLPDVHGSGRKNTAAVKNSSHRDEMVVENGIGKADQNFMRDINWKLGVPFEVMPTSNASHRDLFRNLHIDVVNLEYVTGPRNADEADNDGDGLVDENDENDGVDTNYRVNNIVPEARIMRVGQAVFWTPQGGFDESAEAFMPPGEHVLIEAVANSNPADSTGWGKNSDVAQVRFYTRPADMVGGSPPHNGWTLAGFDDYSPYTIRIDTDRLGAGSFQLMALAEDENGNMEPFPCAGPGDLSARVQDMSGPSISVGGLGLDLSHSNYVPVGIMELLIPYLNSTFIHEPGFEANNLGNSIFPPLSQGGVPKVSGEWLHLYVQSEVYGDVPGDGITVSVYDKNNSQVARPTVAYAKDTKVGDEYKPGEVPHTFILSEQTALLYLPTWQELGVNVPRFEGVWMYYKKVDNVNGTGVTVKPPDPYFVDKVGMTSYYNSKGEHIWKADLNLELGHTYFYYFVVDTVGDTWVMPDPRNLLYEGFVGGSQYSSLMDWFGVSNLFLNVPLVSKIWLPGTPGQADDEIWSTAINLDSLADGVYEVRIEGKDRIGFADMVSKTIVVDRTPPQIDPDVDIKISSSVKAGSVVELRAIIRDSSGINAVETSGVLFEISRKGNTPDAIGVWQYAIGPGSVSYPQVPVPGGWQFASSRGMGDFPHLGTPSWLGKIALDIYPQDGWSALWQTPQTDQQIPIYVRAVPFDDALNVQVGIANQGAVDVDGSVPKAKVVRVSVSRAGAVVEDGADGFVIFPIDEDVTLKAVLVSGSADASGVAFQYNLGAGWVTIPASQYSEAVRTPNSEGEYVIVWQVDFSQLANETRDQYFQVRAVAEDEVGNVDADPIASIMVFDNATPPQVYIKSVDGKDALSPNLIVSRRSFNVEGGDPGTVDVEIRAYNATTVTLEYRSEGGDWIKVATVTGALETYIIQWEVATLAEGIYELRATGYSSSGYPSQAVAVVEVKRTEPSLRDARIWVDLDRDGEYESDELVYDFYRYKDDSGVYYNVRIQVRVEDDLGTRDVVLQYFDQEAVQWETVSLSDGSDAWFSYSAVDDLWTITLEGNDALGLLIPQTANGQDGSVILRALATDYAGNQNSQDRGFSLEAAGIIKGDVNGDGKIQANDAFLALQIAAGIIEPDKTQSQAADMNGDGRVRTDDAIKILRKAAGM